MTDPSAPSLWTPRLSLRHLRLLVGLAELGSISDTARAMSTTQPAISRWLRELEEEVGAPLFERHARGLSPTGHGQVLLVHVRRVLNEMERAQVNLAALHGSSSYRVALGTAPASVTGLVPDAVARYLARHPMARVDVREQTMGLLVEKLARGELDIIVGSLDDYPPTAGLTCAPLHVEPLTVIARAKHPLASVKTPLGWDDLFAYDWILWPEGTHNRQRLDAALTRAGRGPLPRRVESASMLVNVNLIRRTNLLCAVSRHLAGHFAKGADIVALDFDLGAVNAIGMCWRDESLQTAATAEMLECLRQAAGGLDRPERVSLVR